MEYQKLCVLGLGYIGLPTASTFATHGLRVIGVDVNQRIVDTLHTGGLHIHEPGLRTLVSAAIQSGNLTVHTEPAEADAFIIAVPTPLNADNSADMQYVKSAAESIVPYLRKNNLVVLESTSPPKTTTDLVAPILEKSGLIAGVDFYLAYTPERVLPGQILRELIENDRVIGGINPISAQAGKTLYSTFVRGEIMVTDATTAEMVKLMENTYRDVNIALANELSRIGTKLGIDIWQAISMANRHPRVNILRPGPGVGGHCISVDPWFIVETAPELTPLIQTARRVNNTQPAFILQLINQTIGNLPAKKITLLGLSYKPDVDDIRESPGIQIALLLKQAGASVTVFEPFKPDISLDGITTALSLKNALQQAEILVILVAHSQFSHLVPDEIAEMMPGRIIVDTVNTLISPNWQTTGFNLVRPGDGTNRLAG